MIKIFLVPFGSHRVDESRDEDFVAFPDNAPESLIREAVEVETARWDQGELAQAAQVAGINNPDIWMFNQKGDMKPIIVANLIKDYPDAAEYIQQEMGLSVNLQGGDPTLKDALEANVQRWNEAPPHLPNLRKRLFSRIQQEAYAHGLGFFNTKSEIADASARLNNTPAHQVRAFLLGIKTADPDDISIHEILGLVGDERVLTYKSQHGCIYELPELSKVNASRTYLTPVEEQNDDRVYILWEEVYTYRRHHGVIEIETEVWAMLLRIDLKEVG